MRDKPLIASKTFWTSLANFLAVVLAHYGFGVSVETLLPVFMALQSLAMIFLRQGVKKK
ncbi:MAG: hypothetical protein Q6368_003015 [Candidatus Baldrarchaeota archaeon]